MNWNNKITNQLIFLIIIAFIPIAFTHAQDISSQIEKALLKGDTELLRSQLDDKVKLIILGESCQTSKNEAISKLNEFLRINPALKFNAKFESEKPNSNFIIRTMVSKNASFRITVFFVKKESGVYINLLRIEKENESAF